MKVLFKAAAVSVAFAAAFAASPVLAQSYGYYVDHQVDLATPLAAGGGNVTNNAWLNLTQFTDANGVPGISGTGSIFAPLPWSGKASQVDTSIGSVGSSLGGATLSKTANGNGGAPYAASGSMYFGGFSGEVNNFGGTLSVADATPVAGLSTVVLQLGFGEAWTHDLYNDAAPILSYTTSLGTFSMAASFSETLEKFANGTVEMPTGTENIYINQYAYQWDLSGVSEDITAFNVSFSGVQHAQLYGITLTQSDVFTQVVAAPVPEPETYAMMFAGLVGVAAAVRRRKAQQQA